MTTSPKKLTTLRKKYRAFLESKAVIAMERGMHITPDQLNPTGKPHQKDLAAWAITGGNRAIFASFGLGKTWIQIQILLAILERHEGDGLIVCPLGVKAEFVRDALEFFKVHFQYIRTNEEHQEYAEKGQHYFLTNYERVRDGDLDPNRFRVCSLDEASVLRSFGSKTYQTFLALFDKVQFKFVCTATPSPNRFKELIHYAGFLGVMDTGQALTRFFKRDSTQAGNLTLHPHKEREFWLWVSTWATFLNKPSDLGYDDTGYDLPPVKVIRHRLPVDHATAGFDSWGQGKLLRSAAAGLREGAREKRESIDARVAKAREIIDAAGPRRHWLIWHDLESERHAIQKAIPEATSVYGSMNLEKREEAVAAFSAGEISILSTKPSLCGSGCNFQKHCYSAIFMSLDYKANDYMQAFHRIVRFLQEHEVEIHLIYTESEDPVYDSLMVKVKQHEELAATMGTIIKEYGLSNSKAGIEMRRSIGMSRQEVKGDLFACVNNDNVLELQKMADDSVDLIVTSWPFSDHYEYTESYNDFGHNDGDKGFFQQMEFLTPEVMRVLKPGRMYCVHAKDRIRYGSVSGLGMYSVNRFSDKCCDHLEKHGFIFCGRITVATDVVRENNQTYRLGYSENAKDGTKMGVGSPEYVLLFRKLPTDQSTSYADEPVPHEKPLCAAEAGDEIPFREDRARLVCPACNGVGIVREFDGTKEAVEDCPKCNGQGHNSTCLAMEGDLIPFRPDRKIIPGTGYSRGRWQFDAHSFWRSSGNRFLTPEEIAEMPMDQLREMWHRYSASKIYNFEEHVSIAEQMEARGILPSSFMALDPPAPNVHYIWDDVTRMRTLNSEQNRKGWEQHVCPLQLDIVERLIDRYSAKGELVMDPFGGLGTVAYCAILKGRKGLSIELSEAYWKDSVSYCKGAEQKVSMPTLFDMEEIA